MLPLALNVKASAGAPGSSSRAPGAIRTVRDIAIGGCGSHDAVVDGTGPVCGARPRPSYLPGDRPGQRVDRRVAAETEDVLCCHEQVSIELVRVGADPTAGRGQKRLAHRLQGFRIVQQARSAAGQRRQSTAHHGTSHDLQGLAGPARDLQPREHALAGSPSMTPAAESLFSAPVTAADDTSYEAMRR